MFSNGNFFVYLFIVSVQLHLISAETATIRRTNISQNATFSTTSSATEDLLTKNNNNELDKKRISFMAAATTAAADDDDKPDVNYNLLKNNHTKSNRRREKSLPDDDDRRVLAAAATPSSMDAAATGFRIELSQGNIEELPEPMALFGMGKSSASATSSGGGHHHHSSSHHRTPVVAATDGLLSGPLPVFPERSDAVYFVVAVIGGAKVWSRTLARCLMEMGPPFGSPLGPPLRPLYVDLPANGKFSVKVLTSFCQQTDRVPLAGVVVIGDGQSARAIALSGHSMQIPVLWARGGTANIHSTHSEYHATLQSILQPSAREILEAIRALFLQTHWHSFFVLSDVDATMVLAGIEGFPLKQPPLKPTILPLPPADGNVFRQLAEISRSTRGIVLLLCNLVSARNVMSEAKRLNMAGGHFIWLWADTSSTAEFFDVNKSPSVPESQEHNGGDNGDGLVDEDEENLLNYPEAVKQYTNTHSAGGVNENVIAGGKSNPSGGGKVSQHRHHSAPAGFHQRGGFDTSWNPFHNTVDPHKRGSAGDSNFETLDRRGGSSSSVASAEGRYLVDVHESSYESVENSYVTTTKANHMIDSEEYSDEEEENAAEQPGFKKFFEATKFDNKNLDSYYNVLSSSTGGGINTSDSSSSNHQSPKPKRTSSLHYGINASSASSHVLFHHYKDFPVGLLALRPVKMAVDQNFIRSTIRLFASTWAQVQINAARDLEKTRQRVSINPYGDSMSWSPENQDQSGRGTRRRRRGRRRRRRRFIDDNEFDIVNSNQQQQQLKQNSVHRIKNLSSNSSKKTFRSEKVADSSRSSSTNSNININRSGDSNKLNSSFYIHNNNNKENTTNQNNNTSNRSIPTQNSSGSSRNSSYNQNLSGLTNQNNENDDKSKKVNDDKEEEEDKSSWETPRTNNQSNTNTNKQEEEEQSADNVDKNNDDSKAQHESPLPAAGKVKRASFPWSTKKVVDSGSRRSSSSSRRRPTDGGDIVGDDNESKMGSRLAMDDDEDDGNDGRYRKPGTPFFTGGCFGSASRSDVHRAELFSRALKTSTSQAMSGDLTLDGGQREHPLITKFEILNLVPDNNGRHLQLFEDELTIVRHRSQQRRRPRYPSTKWRRVGLIAGRNVHLDTIVWPGGDIVVSGKEQRRKSNIRLALYSVGSSIGLSAKSRTVFRVVTALAPPFVMASELDEDGLCLRGLPCHRLLPNRKHNLTIMFNNIETQQRFTQDYLDHGGKVPSDETDNFSNPMFETKCCYGLSMDLLDNIATELEFEFHLYIVHDELFGAKFSTLNDFKPRRASAKGANAGNNHDTNNNRQASSGSGGSSTSGVKEQQHEQHKTKDSTMMVDDVNDQYPANSNSAANQQQQQKEQQQQQQQRRYHSPEGRTRTRRHSSPPSDGSASLERENSLNSNEFNSMKKKVSSSSVNMGVKQQGRRILKRHQRQATAFNSNDNDAATTADDYNTQTNVEVSNKIDAISATMKDSKDVVEDVSLNDWVVLNDYIDDQEETGAPNDDNMEQPFNGKRIQWNGIIGDLISGSADMSFAPLTVSRARAEVIDFSAPYFHGGVSLLAAPKRKSEIPLLAFLLPFSPELWIAIFTSLNVTAIAVAIYEWLSPFGLNPWGRQRSKNFSMSSALWVMWGLLCGHLVAFKAPKSWPNKFLINVWGGFSVIFIASYTANIAALIAGLFFHNSGNTPEVSLFKQRVGAPVSSSTESFMKQHRPHEWEHIKKYSLMNIEDGIRGLKNGSLDLLLGDTPILDYYRAIDHGCNLLRVGETYVEDTYAIGMKKGFPLKDSISALIAKYSSNGYLDILAEKWYGGLPCFKLDSDIIMPRPLGVAAVAGVFLLLGLGITVGVVILIFEHWFYKFMLPKLRHKPKGTVWRSRNIMFFSQKLYRFINCVELVSPHHAARELVHTLRQGQIASLFQKSIKREDEQRRRRKSKAQFFEMIQEIRRVQQAEKMKSKLEVLKEHAEAESHPPTMQIPEIITPHSRSPKPRSSPRSKLFSSRHKRSRSNSSTLNVRRFSNDSILSDRLDTIGRRLSRDLTNSPPDFGRRFDTLSATNTGSGSTVKFETYSAKDLSTDKIEETKFDTFSAKELTVPSKKHLNKRAPLNSDTFKPMGGKETSGESSSNSTDSPTVQLLPVLREGLISPVCQEDRAQALLRERMHEELITKYGECEYEVIVPIEDSSPPQTSSQRTSFRSSNRSPPLSLMRHRQRSLDGLEQRPKMPSPPRISVDTDSRHVSISRSNLREVSLERLSREDLLRLSESTESEIHDYLSKPAIERSLEPP
ncbi:uncharacterized protein LOC129921359 isoform X2 [Episyrphus balteatus]|uniref:uncharacterized protein LOC129921359 isoform X2 n=1 Tax=Episyrphus balteatus TaxID=286459 RepID=UPI002485626D|nr:uncharacterized protein LOC129921359 isoform X2 [Episyrphus balteatus]